MSLFVSAEEMENFTGCKTSAAQEFALKKHRIKHFVNIKGVVLARAEYERTPDQNRPNKAIPTSEEINDLPAMPRSQVGIYFLYQGLLVVYVGKTTEFYGRMSSHAAGEFIFDSIRFLPLAESALDMMEREYIARFAPMYNKMHNKRIGTKSAAPTCVD